MAKISFTKMQGLGNDFVVLDASIKPLPITSGQMRQLADRHYGVGCDQILLLLPSSSPTALFAYQIFNADGSAAEQCGNGARCLGRYLIDQKKITAAQFRLAAPRGEIEILREKDGLITVNMGSPIFEPSLIPFQASAAADKYSIDLANCEVTAGVVSLGNPHAVILVPEVAVAPVNVTGPLLEKHPRFPQGVNVEFMQIIDSQYIRIRVYERGAGETLACGTGACAAMVIGRLWQQLAEKAIVELPGGCLTIRWSGAANDPVWMTGSAETVFTGHIQL